MKRCAYGSLVLITMIAAATCTVAKTNISSPEETSSKYEIVENYVPRTVEVETVNRIPTKSAYVETEEETTEESLIQSKDWSGEESQLLMKIAMAEAEGESTEGKALVMLVVLNRVWSDEFPGTVEDVIFQKHQFSPVQEGGRWYTTEPDEDCAKALNLVMNGWDESEGALYFESSAEPTWHSQHLEYLFQVGGHKFYR